MDRATLKKALFGAALIAAGFLIADRGLALVLARVVEASNIRFSALYRGGLTADVVVVGDSRAVNAFNAPMMAARLGKTVFNAGYNGISMVVAEALVADYFDHNQPPKHLLIEVTTLGTDNDVLKGLSPYMGESTRLHDLLAREAPVMAHALRVSHLYRYNNELFLRALYYLRRSDQAWINQGAMAEVQMQAPRARKATHPIPVDGPGFVALQGILRLCKRRGVQPVLVISPYLPRYLANRPHWNQWVQTLAARLGADVPLHDYSQHLTEPADFADPIHINHRGSQKLLLAILQDGLLTERP